MATKTKKLGPRTTIEFATVRDAKGKSKKLYINMLKGIAEYYGFKTADKPEVTVTPKKGKARKTTVVGAKGAGSIKVPAVSGTAAARVKTKKYKSIPVPAGATIAQIKAFLAKATKQKPDSFVSVGGRTYPIGSGAVKP